jgi:hypothetical protein
MTPGATASACGWPFLVARGRRRGYRTVLAPDFLAERNLHNVLSESSNGGAAQGSAVCSVDLDHAELGPMTLSYRTEQLTAADLGGASAGDEPVTDEHGRPLEILYGIVARDRLSGPPDGEDLQTARSAALRSYRRFLDEEEGFHVDASRSFALRGVTAVRPSIRTKPHRPPAPPPPAPRSAPAERRPPRAGLGLVAAVAVAALLLAWLLWPKPSKDPTVRIATATAVAPGIVQCGAATTIELTGTITANRATAVRYHWAPLEGTNAKRSLRFAGRGSRSVTTTIAVDAPEKGRVSLVVDAPRSLRRDVSYDVGCVSTPAAPAATTPGTPAPPAATTR